MGRRRNFLKDKMSQSEMVDILASTSPAAMNAYKAAIGFYEEAHSLNVVLSSEEGATHGVIIGVNLGKCSPEIKADVLALYKKLTDMPFPA